MTPKRIPQPFSMLRPAIALFAIDALVACGSAPESKADTAAPATAAADQQSGGVIPGIEVLLSDSMHLIRGKRVGLITNHSGRDRKGTSTIDLLHKAPGVRLTALYAPEHGLRGVAKAGERIVSGVDSATGIPIHSLFGQTRIPTPDM